MAEHHNHDYEAPDVPLDLGPPRTKALLLGIGGLIAWAALGAINLASYHSGEHGGVRDFFLTYQVGFVFWLSLPVGAMALLCLATLTSASWGLVFRRIFQAATRTLPFTALLFLPIAFSLTLGQESPFWWVNKIEELEWAKGNDAVIHEQGHRQHLYLNETRFLLTAAAVFALYWLINSCLNAWGVKSEDEDDHASWVKMRRLAGPGFILWALTFTVIITDWVMSIEPAWASTMFGVIAAMNCFLTTFTFSALVLYTLIGRNETVLSIIKNKFRIDVGSLVYGFTMIWTYATFSQYMLIWAGNMPEEIIYFKKRLEGGWEFMAYALMLIHWLLPFVILLFREVKTDPKKMKCVSVVLLCICGIDIIWWIVPAYPHTDGWAHVPMAVAAIVGVGGVWSWAFFGQLGKRNLLPKKETEFMATWGEDHS